MHISMVSKRYCQLIIFLNFITLHRQLFMRVSGCLELETAFNLMLFLLWTPELPSASKFSGTSALTERAKSLFSSMTLWRFWSVSRMQEVNSGSICSACTLQSEPLKWAVKPIALRKDFPFAANQPLNFPILKIHQGKNAMNWAPAHELPLFDSGDIRKPANKHLGKHRNASDAILTMMFKKCLFYISRKYMINSTPVQKNPKTHLRKRSNGENRYLTFSPTFICT